MKVIKQLSEHQFVIEFDSKNNVTSGHNHSHVIVTHDYVNFFETGFIYRKDLSGPSFTGEHAWASNVIKVPMNAQIGIDKMVNAILPYLNSHEYCQKGHAERYGYKDSFVTFYKDGKKMIALKTDSKSDFEVISYDLYCKLKGIEQEKEEQDEE